jgi:hypothetical protein
MKSSHAVVYRGNDQHRSKHNQFTPTEFIQKVKGQSCGLSMTVSGLGEQHLCRVTLADPDVLGPLSVPLLLSTGHPDRVGLAATGQALQANLQFYQTNAGPGRRGLAANCTNGIVAFC